MKVWMILLIWILGLAMTVSVIVLSFLYSLHLLSVEDAPPPRPTKQYVPRERVNLYFDRR